MKDKKHPTNRLAFLEDSTSKDRSLRQEKRLAKETGGKVQRASGATTFRKGDVDDVPDASVPVMDLKIEAKTTKHHSYRLNYADLQKIEQEAFQDGKKGAMVISFDDRHDYLVIRKDFVIFGGRK